MNDIKLKLKKVNDRYFIGGGRPVNWNPLPANLKNRTEVNQYFKTGNNPQQLLEYSTDAGQPARLYEVYWRNGKYAQAKEDENRTLVINVPPYATKDQITDALRQRAKTVDNKEAVIVFTEEAPEQPEND